MKPPINALILGFIVALMMPLFSGHAQTPGYAEILEPRGGQAIGGVFTILGSASHPAFLKYQLSFALAEDPTATWFLLGEAQSNPVVDGGMGLWDTTGISDGNYRLRLEVFLENDQSLVTIVEGVRIRNQTPVETSTIAPVAAQVTATPAPPTKTPRPTPLPAYSSDGTAHIQLAFTAGALAGLLIISGIGIYLFMRKRARQRWGMMQMRHVLRKQNRDPRRRRD